jgi:hypothetical protein
MSVCEAALFEDSLPRASATRVSTWAAGTRRIDHGTVAKLGAMRRQDESYSDASLALAEAHAGR